MMPTVPIEESSVHPAIDRGIAIAFILIAAGFVALLWTLEPDARGHGTHEQLGMAPCGWAEGPGGIPCPTCGVTTAATYLVQLHAIDAVVTQPFGVALALAGLVLAAAAAVCLFRRRSFLDFLSWLPYGTIIVSGVVLLLLSWWYKYLTFAPPL